MLHLLLLIPEFISRKKLCFILYQLFNSKIRPILFLIFFYYPYLSLSLIFVILFVIFYLPFFISYNKIKEEEKKYKRINNNKKEEKKKKKNKK